MLSERVRNAMVTPTPTFLVFPKDSRFGPDEKPRASDLMLSTRDEAEAVAFARKNNGTVERWMSGEPVTAVVVA